MDGYKGFMPDMKCKSQQYTVGETVHLDDNTELKICATGFHFCLNPLCVFAYYAPCDSRYAKVIAGSEVMEEDNGEFYTTKCCARDLTVKQELNVEDMVFWATSWMRDHAVDNQNAYKEWYCGNTISVTYVPDRHGYWVSSSSLVLATEKHTVIRNTGGAVAITLAAFSIADVGDVWHNVAIACGPQSAAIARNGGSVAISLGCESTAITEADESIAYVGASSLAVVKGKNSFAMTLFRGSKARLDGDNCMAMLEGSAEVNGKGCVVMLSAGYKREATIKAVKGTILFLPFLDGPALIEIKCGDDPEVWPADKPFTYEYILDKYMEKNEDV